MTENPRTIGDRTYAVWPADQVLYSLGGPKLLKTSFTDAEHYHPALRSRILELAGETQRPAAGARNVCGTKIHDPDTWNCPEAELIGARAKALFCRITKSTTAVVDNSWATLYRDGDFCLPHSHLRTEVSVVYMLDTGEPDSGWQGNGRLGFADPRLSVCCPVEPGRMTAPLFPDLAPGDMLMFPGDIIHLVNPYEGERPRITLSWNINRKAIPGARDHHAAQRLRVEG